MADIVWLRTAAPQLRTHIGGALRCGVAREELVEIMMQFVPYAGVAFIDIRGYRNSRN